MRRPTCTDRYSRMNFLPKTSSEAHHVGAIPYSERCIDKSFDSRVKLWDFEDNFMDTAMLVNFAELMKEVPNAVPQCCHISLGWGQSRTSVRACEPIGFFEAFMATGRSTCANLLLGHARSTVVVHQAKWAY